MFDTLTFATINKFRGVPGRLFFTASVGRKRLRTTQTRARHRPDFLYQVPEMPGKSAAPSAKATAGLKPEADSIRWAQGKANQVRIANLFLANAATANPDLAAKWGSDWASIPEEHVTAPELWAHLADFRGRGDDGRREGRRRRRGGRRRGRRQGRGLEPVRVLG